VSVAGLRAEMEYDLSWRLDEIRFLRNQMLSIPGEDGKRKFRRAIVLMLYAHYEGFCKLALQQYVRAINRASVRCSQASPAVVAGTWHQLFTELEDSGRRSRLFKGNQSDPKLHRLARRVEFIEKFEDFQDSMVDMPEDVVDSESNLWPVVLRKNLFRVGLDPEAFEKYDGVIYNLLNKRNGVSHGADQHGLEEKEYKEMEEAVLMLMEGVMELVMLSVQEERFRRPQ
jgi:hypothetical protein